MENEAAIQRICIEASPRLFASNEFVVEKGMPATCAYFIVQGKVRVESPVLTGAKALYLKPPSWIGDVCLFVDTLRKTSVMAVVMTEMLTLEKASLAAVCEEHPDVNEQFLAFQAKILKEGLGGLMCPICGDVGHSVDTCPKRKPEQSGARASLAALRHTFDSSNDHSHRMPSK